MLRNRFRIQAVIGAGGFGKTYLAQDTDRLDAACAIKQFFPQVQGTGARTKAAQLFKEEAKRLFELGESHTQIPKLLAYFEQGSSLFLVQEFIEGETLSTELQLQVFNERRIRQLLADLLPVLQFIHERNIIHRDIKPENIIRRKSDGKLVLIDFGGAKQVTQTSLARQGTGIYTIGYAPSEQMAGYACPASDLYALGATCVRLLTGCLAIQDDYGNVDDPLYDFINAEWLWRERLNEQGVTLSDELGRVLDKLLKYLVRERYQSAAEVLQDLNTTISSVSCVDPTILTISQSTLSPSQKNWGELTLQTFKFDVITVNASGREIRCDRHQAEFFTEDLGNEVVLEMVQIPSGTFIMGSDEHNSAKPRHSVTVKPFFMGKYLVTQEQWKAVMGNNPSYFRAIKRPVEKVSWNDAVEFCQLLSQKTGKTYRLPSEAEWEYACRAGTTTPFHCGETITADLAKYNGGYSYASAPKGVNRKETTPVGCFLPNAFGLYDMHGNVCEWCADPWHSDYNDAPSDSNVWESGGIDRYRLLRGGSWYVNPEYCCCAYRLSLSPSYCNNDTGFRVVCS